MADFSNFIQGKAWYCVRTKPKKERSAAAQLFSLHGLDVFCPQIRFRKKTARGPVWFQEAMFPGYIFVCFDMIEEKRAVSYSPDVLTVPSFNDRYVPVPDRVIEMLKSDLDEEETVDGREALEVGEEAEVLEGAMRGLKVKIIKLMPGQDRVGVLLELLGTLVEAELPRDSLEHRLRHT